MARVEQSDPCWSHLSVAGPILKKDEKDSGAEGRNISEYVKAMTSEKLGEFRSVMNIHSGGLTNTKSVCPSFLRI